MMMTTPCIQLLEARRSGLWVRRWMMRTMWAWKGLEQWSRCNEDILKQINSHAELVTRIRRCHSPFVWRVIRRDRNGVFLWRGKYEGKKGREKSSERTDERASVYFQRVQIHIPKNLVCRSDIHSALSIAHLSYSNFTLFIIRIDKMPDNLASLHGEIFVSEIMCTTRERRLRTPKEDQLYLKNDCRKSMTPTYWSGPGVRNLWRTRYLIIKITWHERNNDIIVIYTKLNINSSY